MSTRMLSPTPAQMPSVMGDLIGHTVNALAVIGVACLIWFAVRAAWRRLKPAQDASAAIVAAQMRQHIEDQAKRRQAAIEAAVSGDNPADDLADLGNERRGE